MVYSAALISSPFVSQFKDIHTRSFAGTNPENAGMAGITDQPQVELTAILPNKFFGLAPWHQEF